MADAPDLGSGVSRRKSSSLFVRTLFPITSAVRGTCGSSSVVECHLAKVDVAGPNPVYRSTCGCSSMVEPQPSKLVTWVRFPSPAPAKRFITMKKLSHLRRLFSCINLSCQLLAIDLSQPIPTAGLHSWRSGGAANPRTNKLKPSALRRAPARCWWGARLRLFPDAGEWGESRGGGHAAVPCWMPPLALFASFSGLRKKRQQYRPVQVNVCCRIERCNFLVDLHSVA